MIQPFLSWLWEYERPTKLKTLSEIKRKTQWVICWLAFRRGIMGVTQYAKENGIEKGRMDRFTKY